MRGWVAVLWLSGCASEGLPTPPEPTKLAYLNFEGVTLEVGESDAAANTTNAFSETTTLAPFLAMRADRDAVIDAIARQVEDTLRNYDIGIVTERPSDDVPYMMIAYTGNPQDYGFNATSLGVYFCRQQKPTSISLQFQTEYSFDAVVTAADYHASQAISMIGMAFAIPPTNTANDCMCFVGTNCFAGAIERCTMHSDAELGAIPPDCDETGPVDVPARFLAELGPRG